MTVQEFFAQLPEKADPAKTAGMHNTYVFDVEGVGQWTVSVDDGTVSVTEGAGEADCTITASEETLVKIASGEANPTTAYMTGKLKIQGDMGAALKLQKLFCLRLRRRLGSRHGAGCSASSSRGRSTCSRSSSPTGRSTASRSGAGGPSSGPGAILALANAFLRPIVKILALPLIVVTLGIAYFFVSTLMLLVTEWISPDLRIDGFWTYVGATIVVGLVNWLASLAVAPVVGRRS